MWLQNFRVANKALSPIELLVLASLSEEYTNASTLIDQLKSENAHWKPKRGTIYPILHRLVGAQLLDRAGLGKMEFKRSSFGTNILLSMPDAFIQQIEATTNYLTKISNSLIKIDSSEAIIFLGNLREKIEIMLDKVKELENIAKTENDDWHEVSLTDE